MADSMQETHDERPQPLLPQITEENRPFWDACGRRELTSQYCRDCDGFWFPPSTACPNCLSENYVWQALSGRGVVYSWILFRREYHPAYPPPYNVAIVELDEGIRMITNIVGCEPDRIHIDDRVAVEFENLRDGVIIPKFRLETP